MFIFLSSFPNWRVIIDIVFIFISLAVLNARKIFADLPLEEIVRIFEDFLNDHSMFTTFQNEIEEKGYKLAEFGIEEE